MEIIKEADDIILVPVDEDVRFFDVEELQELPSWARSPVPRTTSKEDTAAKAPYISADDINVDLEKINEELVLKLTMQIDKLIDTHKGRDLLDTSEKEDLEKMHQENIRTIKLKAEKQMAKIRNQVRTDIEAENTSFMTEKENLLKKQCAIRDAIANAVCELSKKLGKLTEEEENTELKKAIECPICFDEMKPPTRIFHCTSGHLICEMCKDRMRAVKCPTCKEADIMGRAIALEQMARSLYPAEK